MPETVLESTHAYRAYLVNRHDHIGKRVDLEQLPTRKLAQRRASYWMPSRGIQRLKCGMARASCGVFSWCASRYEREVPFGLV